MSIVEARYKMISAPLVSALQEKTALVDQVVVHVSSFPHLNWQACAWLWQPKVKNIEFSAWLDYLCLTD